jgi:hypothetical protein
VSGIPQMIDTLVANVPDAAQGFRLLFAAGPFPENQIEFVKVREEYQGVWYRWRVAPHKAGFAQRCFAILTRHHLGSTREPNRFIDRVPSLPTMQPSLLLTAKAVAPDRFVP